MVAWFLVDVWGVASEVGEDVGDGADGDGVADAKSCSEGLLALKDTRQCAPKSGKKPKFH